MPSQSTGPMQRKVSVYNPLPGGTPWFEATETPPVLQDACSSVNELPSHQPSSDEATPIEPCMELTGADNDLVPADMSSDSYPTYVGLPIEQLCPVKAEIDDPLSLHSHCSPDVKLPLFPEKLEVPVFDSLQQQSVRCHCSSPTPHEPGRSVVLSQPIEAGESYPLQQESCNLDQRFEPRDVKPEPCDSLYDSLLQVQHCSNNAETSLTATQVKPDFFYPLVELPGSNNIPAHSAHNCLISSDFCLKSELRDIPSASLSLDPLSDAVPTSSSPWLKSYGTGFHPETFPSSRQENREISHSIPPNKSRLTMQPCFVNLGVRVETRRVKAEATLAPLQPVTSAGGSRQIYVPLANTRPWFTVHPAPALSTTQPIKLELNEAPLTLAEGRSTSESPRSIGDGGDFNIELTTTLDEADDHTCTSHSNQIQDINKSPRRNHPLGDSTPDTEVVRESSARQSSQGNERNVSKKGSGQPRQLKDRTRGDAQRSTGVLQCNICSRGFNAKSQLMRHMLTHTDDRHNHCPSPSGKTFKAASTLKSHSYTRMATKPYVCHICKQDFIGKNALVAHMCSHTGIKTFSCAECGKGFTSKGALSYHILSHSGDRPHKCSCGKAFKVASSLKTHSYTHTAKKPFDCHICKLDFTNKSQLLAHMYSHTGVKPFNCAECGKEFTSKSSLTRHIYSHMAKKPFDCHICNLGYAYKSQLLAHMYSHTGIKPFTCKECGKGFTRNECLTRHIPIHSKDRPYKCSCGKAFKVARTLWAHSYTHMAKKPFVCRICKIDFATKSQLSAHMCSHTGIKPFNCEECGKGFTFKYKLTKHKYTHTAKKPLVCHICKRGFTDKSQLVIHMCSHTSIKPFTCAECGKGFTSKRYLSHHKYTHMAKKPFVCHICKQDFTTKRQLLPHMCSHTGIKPFICAECGKGFGSKYFLSQHICVHSEDRPYKCSCGKGFKVARDLRVHSYTHMAKKPLDCRICKLDFASKSQLLTHMYSHTGTIKPFTCAECGKGFSSKNSLTNHIYTHMTKKPFDCHICKLDFAAKSQLLAHMCSHTGIKPFTCAECGKGFTLKSTLTNHIYTHMTKKPFDCHICKRGFTEKSQLVRHMCSHTQGSKFL